jgi:hypothetical protein
MKFTQIAIFVPVQEEFKQNFLDTFGYEMYTDTLRMIGFFNGRGADVDLTLSFNHDVMDGVEIEYITSENANHWHREKMAIHGKQPFLSHLGIYCTKKEFDKYCKMFDEMGYEKLQDSTSYSHSNKREEDGDGPSSRSYHDVIFNTEKFIGFNIKLSSKVDKK